MPFEGFLLKSSLGFRSLEVFGLRVCLDSGDLGGFGFRDVRIVLCFFFFLGGGVGGKSSGFRFSRTAFIVH